MSKLDNPVWWALAGPQRHLGTTAALAARFDPDVSPFGALAEDPTDAHWDDLAGIIGPGGQVALVAAGPGDLRPAPGWTIEWELAGVQMVASGGGSGSGPSRPHGSGSSADVPRPLGTADVDDMLALVEVARPGPFLSRTIEFGGYLGIRRQGQLVAMAGERLRPSGYTEVSAVATDPAHRRQGLAEVLVSAVMGAIVRRGTLRSSMRQPATSTPSASTSRWASPCGPDPRFWW